MQKSDRTQVLKQKIDARVAAYFASPDPRMGVRLSSNGEQLLDLLAEFTARPSKRLRGILAATAYELFGGNNHSTAVNAALAMELTQSYLLIIDDVMDRSAMRRGGLTIHQEYLQAMQHAFPKREIAHEADMAAIIVGELAQHLASTVLNGIDEPAERVLKAERFFHANVSATAHGQIDDLFGSIGQLQTIPETLAMYVRKTCHYTFIAPLQTGAILAGATDTDLAVLKDFGIHAGVAFQLQDDDIGMFGDERVSGKSSLDDLREGKMTVLMRHGLAHAPVADVLVLRAALGNKRVTHRQHLIVQEILERAGSRRYTQQEIRRENALALAVLDAQKKWNISAKQSLHNQLESLISRVS